MDPAHRDHLLNALWVAEEQGRPNLEGLRTCARKPVEDSDVDGLIDEGLVEPEGASLLLSAAGQVMAQALIRRYRLSEALLHIVYGRDAERASSLACELEHDLRPEMTDALCTFLGHPATCPHGHPIPPGSCCNLHLTTVASPVVPLTELEPGERGRVVYLHPRNHERLHRLSSLGLTPNVVLTVHQRLPAWCVRFEGTELAFDRDVAADIFVARLKLP
jgi:DtxR family transcriptional regulator, Mn-dependent transcriptional regulator